MNESIEIEPNHAKNWAAGVKAGWAWADSFMDEFGSVLSPPKFAFPHGAFARGWYQGYKTAVSIKWKRKESHRFYRGEFSGLRQGRWIAQSPQLKPLEKRWFE